MNKDEVLVNSSGTYRDANYHKLRYDLIPLGPLSELAKAYTYGASHYGERNWEGGMQFSRCYAAALRHMIAWWNGTDVDPDSKRARVKHLASAAWNIFALMHYCQVQTLADKWDDRPYQAELAEMNTGE